MKKHLFVLNLIAMFAGFVGSNFSAVFTFRGFVLIALIVAVLVILYMGLIFKLR